MHCPACGCWDFSIMMAGPYCGRLLADLAPTS
jgi:hypothetical protein